MLNSTSSAAEALDRRAHGTLAVGGARQVGFDKEPFATLNLGGRPRTRDRVDIGDRHARTLARELERRAAAHSQRAARDQGDFPVERTHEGAHCSLVVGWRW